MQRQAKKLAALIKPAIPSTAVLEQITHTTQTRLESNLNILDTHYKLMLHRLSEHLPSFDQIALEKAFAYGWSKYKKKNSNNSPELNILAGWISHGSSSVLTI